MRIQRTRRILGIIPHFLAIGSMDERGRAFVRNTLGAQSLQHAGRRDSQAGIESCRCMTRASAVNRIPHPCEAFMRLLSSLPGLPVGVCGGGSCS